MCENFIYYIRKQIQISQIVTIKGDREAARFLKPINPLAPANMACTVCLLFSHSLCVKNSLVSHSFYGFWSNWWSQMGPAYGSWCACWVNILGGSMLSPPFTLGLSVLLVNSYEDPLGIFMSLCRCDIFFKEPLRTSLNLFLCSPDYLLAWRTLKYNVCTRNLIRVCHCNQWSVIWTTMLGLLDAERILVCLSF